MPKTPTSTPPPRPTPKATQERNGLASNAIAGAEPPPLTEQLPADWREALGAELEKPYVKELERFVAAERAQHAVLPDPENVFAALRRTPLEQVKVVLLGQDPYPTRGNATGLSFSVPRGQPIPGSLRNMLKVMQTDVGAKLPSHGNLESWAAQGVLLLNTVLTVREGEPNSHKNRGWEQLTQAMLDAVNRKSSRVVFLLLGKQAQQCAASVDTTRHVIVSAPHPSPASPGNPFGKTRPFSAVNRALEEAGEAPIQWELPEA